MPTQTELARLVIRLEADTKAIRASLAAADSRMKKSAATAATLKKAVMAIFGAGIVAQGIRKGLIVRGNSPR